MKTRLGLPLLLSVLLLGGWSRQTPRPSQHDFHVSYANLAVENNVAMLRVRFFRDDLESALGAHSRRNDFRMDSSLYVDSLFVDYFKKRVVVNANGTDLDGQLITSGEDELDREPVWWYMVKFDSATEITSMTMRNTLLLEVFDDQKNIVKVAHFPGNKQRSYYFARGEETAVFDFW
ncbi:MAG: hypothetical protein HKN43_04725 [Rhodothermales bacterium]|nr:hypothetical protein [Rhodothermales bacterium]